MRNPIPPSIASVLVLGLLAAMPVAAQDAQAGGDEGEPVVMARSFTVASEVLGEDRPVAVGLPEGYDPERAYPVIYVLDGLPHMMHTLGTVRFLARNDRMPEAIVVTVGNTPGNRTRDLTPPATPGSEDAERPGAGGAADFQAFLGDELKPWIEARYPTRPYDVLIGHSFGGLFVSHVLDTDPDLFDAYVAISPSLWWDEERFVASMEDVFERFPDARGSLYVTMGDEGGSMLAGAWRLTATLEKHAPDGFRWRWAHMPAESHGSVPARSTYDGLEWIFSPWHPADLLAELGDDPDAALSRIEGHFERLSEEVGWEVDPPLTNLVNTAYRLGEDGRAEDALTVARAATDWFPESAYARLGVGTALEAACRLEEAGEHVAEAVRMAEADPGQAGILEFARSELERIEREIESGDACTT